MELLEDAPIDTTGAGCVAGCCCCIVLLTTVVAAASAPLLRGYGSANFGRQWQTLEDVDPILLIGSLVGKGSAFHSIYRRIATALAAVAALLVAIGLASSRRRWPSRTDTHNCLAANPCTREVECAD